MFLVRSIFAAIDVQAWSAATSETAVRGAALVARVFLVDGAVLRRHGRGFLDDHPPAGGHDEEHLLAVVRRDRLVGAGSEHDVGNPERARQELHVRQNVALALREDAGSWVEVGGCIRQCDDFVSGVRAILRRNPQPAQRKAGVEGADVGVDLGAEEVVAGALRPGGVVVEAACDLRVEQQRRAAQDVVSDRRRLRQQKSPRRPHLGEGEHRVALRPLDRTLRCLQLRGEVLTGLLGRSQERTQRIRRCLALPVAEQAGAVGRIGEGTEELQVLLHRLDRRRPAAACCRAAG